jgi:hypothetical protein
MPTGEPPPGVRPKRARPIARMIRLSQDEVDRVAFGLAYARAHLPPGHSLTFGSLVRDLLMSWAAEMERTAGLEPATSGLGSRRSTNRAAPAWKCNACGDTGTVLVYGEAEPCVCPAGHSSDGGK